MSMREHAGNGGSGASERDDPAARERDASAAQGGSAVTVRRFVPADAPAVRDLMVAAYGDAVDPQDVYEWWSNGHLPDATGYMVAEIDGRIVGAQPMELFPYLDGDREMTGGVLTGVGVHPGHRRKGVFTALVEACEAEAWRRGASFVTTMPNDKSRPGFIKMGYVDLGRRRFLVRLLRAATLGGAVVPVLGHIGGAGATAAQVVMSRVVRASGAKVREVSGAPVTPGASKASGSAPAALAPSALEAWPGLFARQAGRIGGVGVSRNREWLQWRYLRMPRRRYRYFEAHADGRCMGVAISTQERRGRAMVGYIMEMAVENESIAASLLRTIFELMRRDGVHAVASVVSAPAVVRLLRAGGMLEVPAWTPVKRFYSVVRFNPALDVPDRWKRIGGWRQTLGDWDSL